MTSENPPREATEGVLLWEPSEARKAATTLARYMRWLRETRGLTFETYQNLWTWSVADLEAFWGSLWDFFEVRAQSPYTRVLADRAMPGAVWFPGVTLNYAEHALRRRDGHLALICTRENAPAVTLTYAELGERVGAAAAGLRRLGVGRGDRVVGFLPNTAEALIAFLATASIGAIWSCCSPEFGVASVVDRFQQIEPSVLIAVDGYRYGGRAHDRRDALAELRRQLPTLRTTVLVPYLGAGGPAPGGVAVLPWAELLATPGELTFEPVPFDHPLWVLYSSGTTGLPKAIVQGHGGILLEHLKSNGLHLDITPDDRFFWFTTTGWMMWNFLVSAPAVGAAIVLFDGNPGWPDLGALWRLAEEAGVTYFGTSAPFLLSCRKAAVQVPELPKLRGVGSTGAPLTAEGY
ncbi:MAG: acetoacetyl-CoA synthetase, partial [Chloroflexota bacterium]|nr:acetoacetyl-CoA synthetase [Chloroflexota bacterium]